MMRKLLLGLGVIALLGGPAFAAGEPVTATGANETIANPQRPLHRVRLNRGVYGLVGQQPNIPRLCEGQGAERVRTTSNGWDVLFGVVTVGLYTPQHAYIICNPGPG